MATNRTQTLKIRLLTTLAGWSVAFLIVYVMLSLFAERLEKLPIALNALIFTGVLVPIMGNLVMPVLGAVITRIVGHTRATDRN